MSRTFIIAEAGVNHNGDIEIAKKLVDVAADAGVDAVKFQTFNPKELVTRTASMADYQSRQVEDADTQLSMLEKLAFWPRASIILFASSDVFSIGLFGVGWSSISLNLTCGSFCAAFSFSSSSCARLSRFSNWRGKRERKTLLQRISAIYLSVTVDSVMPPSFNTCVPDLSPRLKLSSISWRACCEAS
ncbi:MAG: hypothetical protein EBT20_20520 [Alphaproteobacteria bacterium]|nr:hypothetical protein [Alphaproteobacteria bacterium]